MIWTVRNVLIGAAVLRGLYGFRPLLAGGLHNAGYPGMMGYPELLTASIAERPLLPVLFGLIITISYFVIAWGAWRHAAWLGFLALALFFAETSGLIIGAFDNEYHAEHATYAAAAFIHPDLIDWALFGLEMIVFGGVLYLVFTAHLERRKRLDGK